MNNETKHNYLIKYRNDGVYDIYVDGNFIISKGSITSAVKELEAIMIEADEYMFNETK
jgi:hypothetical protein